jgi:glutathione S-transferase
LHACIVRLRRARDNPNVARIPFNPGQAMLILYELCGRDPERVFSPHCWKARMALAHKGLEFQTRPTPFTKVPEIAGGFSKTVPVLDDDGTLVRDSFDIALYLERKFPDRPSLFGGPGGEAMARFFEKWSLLTIHAQLMRCIVADIHSVLGDEDQAYFRSTREARFGMPLEEVQVGREERLDAFHRSLQPLRETFATQPFLGGDGPLFADYIVFGPFQWARMTSPMKVLSDDDPVAEWFGRCVALYEGMAAMAKAA